MSLATRSQSCLCRHCFTARTFNDSGVCDACAAKLGGPEEVADPLAFVPLMSADARTELANAIERERYSR
jgi:hypothetical protein